MTDNEDSGPGSASVAEDLQTLRDEVGAQSSAGFGAQILSFVIIILFIAGAGFWFLRSERADNSILIHNAGLTGLGVDAEQQWIAEATEHAILAYLDVGERVHIVDGDRLDRDTQSSSGAAWTISGAITAAAENADTLNLALQLQSTKPGGEVFSAQLTGMKTGLRDLSSRAAAQIYTWLERPELSEDQLAAAAAELPASQDARRAYAQGITALARFDAAEAVPMFEVALRDGDHPLVFAGLARAWDQLGYRERAKQASQKAHESRSGLSRQRQLEIEGYYRITHDEWARATEVYQALKEFHPSDIFYRLALAEVQLKASDVNGVQQNIKDMRALPADLKDDPRIDLVEADYWHQTGNYANGAAAAEIAAEKARISGDQAVLASALLSIVDNFGDNKIDHLLEAQKLYAGLDNPGRQSVVLRELGQQERYAGRIIEAEDYYRQAIRAAQVIGDSPRESAAKNPLAITLDLKGELSNGLALKREVLAYYRSRNIKSRESIMLENIGISLFKLGRLADAEKSFDEALALFKIVDDKIGIAWAPYHRSRIAAVAGDLEKAARLADEAVENSNDNPEGDLENNAKFEVAAARFFRGDYAEAKRLFLELEKAFGEEDNALSAAESSHMLARIALREKDYETARSKTREALSIYETGGVGYYILDTYITRADLAFKHFIDDRPAACTALKQKLQGIEHAQTVLRARARVQRCDRAADELPSIEATAKDLGVFEPQLDVAIIRAQLWEQLGQETFADKAREAAQQFAASKNWAPY